ncbi:MAG: glycoside hydrolase family 3 C-terminal domain-containing protein [Atopobiaceae bacterium]
MAKSERPSAVGKILARMTLEQKCALLGGAAAFSTRGFQALDVPQTELSDGPHGLRHQSAGANHTGSGGSDPATCFPTAATMAASWDPMLGEEIGRALGQEAAAQGVGVVLGPGLNIKRSPLCGRNFEYFSEDPYLAGKIAAGYVRGIQGTGIAACAKHFAVNSQETKRQASDSVLDERTLREIYLTGFEIVVREAAPRCIMSSYNKVNGTYANENHHLLTDILRNEWGFDGVVMSDWGACSDSVAAAAAGSSLTMPDPGLENVRILMQAVDDGRLSQHDIDARAAEVLELALHQRRVLASAPTQVDFDAHHALARKAAAESIVLLKNEVTASGNPLLPLAPGTEVALIGSFAEEPRYQGAGSSQVNATRVDTLLDLVKESPLQLLGFERGFNRDGTPDQALAERAAQLAARAQVAVVCLGLNEGRESEGMDRRDLRISQNQVDLLEAVAQANPNVVVLLSAGSAVEVPWARKCRSLVYLALSGQAGAAAALDVLTGTVNPSGKLAETWPVRLEDTPTYGNYPSRAATAEYREGLYVGYRYYQTAHVPVAFPFGFGLSYTSFEYSDLEVCQDHVSFEIKNVGERGGAEISQLYVSKPDARVFRPAQELKGFSKVYLKPNESRRITIALDDKAFRYFNVQTHSWEVEPGLYEVRIGASCADIRLRGSLAVSGTRAPNPYEDRSLAPYRYGYVAHVGRGYFKELMGTELPTPRVQLDRNLCLCDLNHGRSPIMWALWLGLTVLEHHAQRSATPNADLEFVYNMPLRSIAQMSGGTVSLGMVDGLVWEVRGLWGLGIAWYLLGYPVNALLNLQTALRLQRDNRQQLQQNADSGQEGHVAVATQNA